MKLSNTDLHYNCIIKYTYKTIQINIIKKIKCIININHKYHKYKVNV